MEKWNRSYSVSFIFLLLERGKKIMQRKVIKKGQKVEFINTRKAPRIYCSDDDRVFSGVVVYVNEPHRWFQVEYDGIGTKLKIGFKFSDIGQSVRVCGDTTVLVDNDRAHYGYGASSLNPIDRRREILDYLSEKLNIMRELGVTPTPREWDHISSLETELQIDNAVRTVLKKRWAKRNYKGVNTYEKFRQICKRIEKA